MTTEPTLSRDYSTIHIHPWLSSTRNWFFKALELTDTPGRTYLEIGVAHGETFCGICKAMDLSPNPWRAIGVDLAQGGWCYNPGAIEAGLRPWPLTISGHSPETLQPKHPVITTRGSEDFLRTTHLTFELVFIDACHSTACATSDFTLVEPKVKPGGIVLFHDADPDSQGDSFELQPHCAIGIGVRRALNNLGLLSGGRPGWKLLADTPGSKTGPRGSVAVQRT